MKKRRDQPSVFQSVWLRSRLNGAPYVEPPRHARIWPHGWLEKRLEALRKGEPVSLEDRLRASVMIVEKTKKGE